MDIEKAANKVPEAAPCIIISGQLNKGKTITFESIESFLANNGRKTVHMKLDGNCFYKYYIKRLALKKKTALHVQSVITRMEN